MPEIRKHYTRQELLEKLGEARADSRDESQPRLGYPRKPRNLPRNLSKRWDKVAEKLDARKLLWTWSRDAELILKICYTQTLEEQKELYYEFACRIPGAEPGPQIAQQKECAEYWSLFSADDLKRLYLTTEEATALAGWVQDLDKPLSREASSFADPRPGTTPGQKLIPGVPVMPDGLPPTIRALWKVACVAVMFGEVGPDNEFHQMLEHEDGAQNFFVDRLIESLPYLQKGLKPRV